jgi:transposase
LQRRRQRAIDLLHSGLAPVAVAQRLGVDRRSVRRWNSAYKGQGQRGIRARLAPGRPKRLAEKARQRLQAILLAGAAAAGFETDLWTCPRVAQIIHRRFGVRYHVDHIGRLLRSFGWTPQRPQRLAVERDEEKIRGWVEKRWPLVKKTPRD